MQNEVPLEHQERLGSEQSRRARRKGAVGLRVGAERQADLFQVVSALGPPPGLPRGLDRWQQDRHQDANDRDDDKKLHQSKSAQLAAS